MWIFSDPMLYAFRNEVFNQNPQLQNSPVPVPDQEVSASLSILLQILLLGTSFIIGHILRRRKFYYLHEASAALLIGLFAGTVANVANCEANFKKWLNFREEFFLLFLLPPIIFESGFSLQVKPFFSNFGAICAFAFLGTLISAVVIATLVYLGGVFFLMFKLTFLESMVFGSLISATDPVTVLAIFQELEADTDLYSLVFGEAVLNDAAALVMYRTLIPLIKNPLRSSSIIYALGSSVVVLFGSLAIGVLVALSCALIFKYAGLSVTNLHKIECCLIVLFPYISYMLAEGSSLSGIVSILFCGILMKHYTFPNLSKHSQTLCIGFFQIIASLAETFTFIYMGVDIALDEKQSWSHVSFIVLSIAIIVIARACNVFPVSYVVNLFREKREQIPARHQQALFYSGLRGAMAFALALQSVHDLPNGIGEIIFSATTTIVMVTVLLIGGSTSTMLNSLNLVEGKRGSHSMDTGEEEMSLLTTRVTDTNSGKKSSHLQRRFRFLSDSAPSFSQLDSKYIRPFFTSVSGEFENAAQEGSSVQGSSQKQQVKKAAHLSYADFSPLDSPSRFREWDSPESAPVKSSPDRKLKRSLSSNSGDNLSFQEAHNIYSLGLSAPPKIVRAAHGQFAGLDS